MKILYFLKWPVLIFLTGFLVRFTGSLGKIMHWPGADGLITVGTLIGGIGILAGILKILFMKKTE